MIYQINKEDCSGCGACTQICPTECIKMSNDSEGFSYPDIDIKMCIKCGKCSKICPSINHDGGHKSIKIYAVKNRNDKVRKTSSSGGVFYELAAKHLKNGGVVYGCAFDFNMIAKHVLVNNCRELKKLQGSKYVQSDIGDSYKKVKELLCSGKKVIFSGTPCQIVGLINFLGKEHDNLLLIDVLCHGVPSPKLFADYLEYLSSEFKGAKPISINFRSKKRGWKRLYMEVYFDNGKRYYTYGAYDPYESLFFNNISLRPSCYQCKFAKSSRYGDITLGDFWGIGKKSPEWDDDKGISLVMINTLKGETFWNEVSNKFIGRSETFESACDGQRTLSAPTKMNPRREEFYKMYERHGFECAVKKFTHTPSKLIQQFYAVSRWCLDLFRKLVKKGY